MSRLDELIQELCPDGVEFKSLGEVCQLVTGATPSKTRKEYWENGTIPWMSSGEVNNKRIFTTESKITQKGYDCTSTTIVPVHSVVMALAGQGKTRGKVAITEIELCTNQSLCSIICNKSLDYRFLYYYLDGKYEELRAISNGDGTRGGLSLRILTPYKIPVPPLSVQNEIVRILDDFTEVTAKLMAELETELTARKRQSNYYRNKLLSFDSNVDVLSIAEICHSVSSGKAKTKATSGNYPVYGSTGVIARTNQAVYTKTNILVARVGANAGYTHLAHGEYDVSDNTLILDVKEEYNLKYIYYQLVNTDLHRLAKGGGQPLVTAGQIKQVLLPVPLRKEQDNIVSILDRFDSLCNNLLSGLSSEIEARQKQYEYYRDNLLTFAE